jgi:hypothetical protein
MNPNNQQRAGYRVIRPLLFNGKQFKAGDVFYSDASLQKLKTLVSSRKIIADAVTIQPSYRQK